MQKIPAKFILTRKPKEYLKQGLTHCGVYCVKAILSAYNKDNKRHPREYQTNWIGRNLFSFAIGQNYYDKILASYGIRSETKSAEDLPNPERIELLKTLLSKDTPVMIRIGNGFILNNRYNLIFGRIIPHWITLWGYDNTQQIFYVYDSGLPKRYWKDKSLPIGNTTRTYNEILRDWRFGRWQPTAWHNSPENYLFVQIHSGRTT